MGLDGDHKESTPGWWTAIAVTCRRNQPSNLLQTELDILQEKGVFPADIPVILVEDPEEDIGSGGSTLNALVVISEHICARRGHTVLSVDLLQDFRILIIHLGNNFLFDPCGRAFILFSSSVLTDSGCLVRSNPLIHLYQTVTRQLSGSDWPAGVWVCGSDAFLHLKDDFVVPKEHTTDCDILVFTTLVSALSAEGHGVYKLNNKDYVENIIYRGCPDDVSPCAVNINGEVPLVIALLFMKASVAESLLLLHSAFPLSLFFDFLLPTCGSVSFEDFVNGDRAGSMGLGVNTHCEQRLEQLVLMPKARSSLWHSLHGYRTKAVFVETSFYHYFTNNLDDFTRFVDYLNMDFWKDNQYILADTPSPDISAAGSYPLCIRLRNLIWLQPGEIAFACVLIHSELGFQGSGDSCSKEVSLLSSKFPVIGPVKVDGTLNLSEAWRLLCYEQANSYDNCGYKYGSLTLESLKTIIDHADLAWYFNRKRKLVFDEYWSYIETVLQNNQHSCILPLFKSACIDGLENDLFDRMDKHILAILAGNKGGLRSGPAANKQWKEAVELLDSQILEKGVYALAKMRKQWMSKPTLMIRAARHYEAAAQIFIRKTVMSVEKFVNINVDDYPSAVGTGWHTYKAAVRIDLAGGWSDTPPITYEYGGAVLNAAINIDGKKPVGAKCRCMVDPGVKIILESDNWTQELLFSELSEIECYSNPSSPGSLVCAVLVCTKLVNVKQQASNLSDQISKNLPCGYPGLEIHCWSHLPQGSGLGTSSILAGCLLAAVWKTAGRSFDVDSLLHAVLYVEQLLTSGGGWQDQVGGLVPGLKLGRFVHSSTGSSKIVVEKINIEENRLRELEERLLLVYTGKTRLAKNLLQEVIRNWYSRQRNILEIVAALVSNAEKGKKAAEACDWEKLAECACDYWQQKKSMAPGCEPKVVSELLHELRRRNLIQAGWLAGAGGGGYLYLLTRQPQDIKHVRSVIGEIASWRSAMSVHSVQIDTNPLVYTLEN